MKNTELSAANALAFARSVEQMHPSAKVRCCNDIISRVISGTGTMEDLGAARRLLGVAFLEVADGQYNGDVIAAEESAQYALLSAECFTERKAASGFKMAEYLNRAEKSHAAKARKAANKAKRINKLLNS